MKHLLLQNEKLMLAQEKIKTLVAICASLPVIADEVALLAAGVPEPDAAIITGAATCFSVGPETSTRGITPQGTRAIGALELPLC